MVNSRRKGAEFERIDDNEIIKALDILDKMDFFEGQRAGRELWFDKPVDVQNEDIRDFAKDIAFLKDFINRQKAENERLTAEANRYKRYYFNHEYDKIKSEARKEFAERLKERATKTTWISDGELVEEEYKISREDLDNILAEMEERE